MNKREQKNMCFMEAEGEGGRVEEANKRRAGIGGTY